MESGMSSSRSSSRSSPSPRSNCQGSVTGQVEMRNYREGYSSETTLLQVRPVSHLLSHSSTPSCQALKGAVSNLYRIDDFHLEKIGAGFFSEVFKVQHKTSGTIMVLKLNKHRSNRNNMLKEVQLLNKLSHPNILRFEAACVHQGQLHALTEYVNYGNLEQLIQNHDEDLPWSVRMSLALDIAKGLEYIHAKGLFHRDLTSKNVLIRKSDGQLSAILADFGLAAKIPSRSDFRLPQVGSPYWMSPECLRGKYYDEKADSFSFGIVLCELIGRLNADPDVLPRTENFGVDYIAFSALCTNCPPDFIKIAFRCVRIDPKSRPSTKDLVGEMGDLLESQKRMETRLHFEGKITLRVVGHKRSLTSDEEVLRKSWSPSERARFHLKSSASQQQQHLTVLSVGKEMSLRDPDYIPSVQNPFLNLPRLREGRKVFGSSRDIFSSCFEFPSPARVPTPSKSAAGTFSHTEPSGDSYPNNTLDSFFCQKQLRWTGSKSLPPSPTSKSHKFTIVTATESPSCRSRSSQPLSTQKNTVPILQKQKVSSSIRLRSSMSASRFEDHLFEGRVQLLKRLYSGGDWLSQDDSAVEMSYHSLTPGHSSQFPRLVRRGSCESGIYSVGTDDLFIESGLSSSRSLGSSLLTVSDLEEDLRAASAYLTNQRTSSVLSDSMEDLLNQEIEKEKLKDYEHAYEKDIRNIVEYFEASCRKSESRRNHKSVISRSGVAPRATGRNSDLLWSRDPQVSILHRSQKIDSLIKRVVEKETMDRLRNKIVTSSSSHQRMQMCDGIVSSKLPLFDEQKFPSRNQLSSHQKGFFVRSKMAMFDSKTNMVGGKSGTKTKPVSNRFSPKCE